MLDTLLAQTGLGLDFAALAEVGTAYISPDPVIPFADGAFATPSGKIELASDAFEAAGLPRAPAALGGRPARRRQAAPAVARLALAHEQQLR